MKLRFKNSRGMTLLEVMMAILISTGIVGALFVFMIPWVNVFTALVSSGGHRSELVGIMDMIEKESSEMMTVYVDSSTCYASCMVDNAGNRVYYYWDPGTAGQTYRSLYRKVEPTTSAISCSGGKVFARNLDTTKTSFAVNNSLFRINLVGKGDTASSIPFTVFNVVFPSAKERKYLFTEGFECNSLASGWIVNSGASSTWSVQQSSTGIGKYVVVDSQGGAGSNTSTIEVPVDLGRVSSAVLSFNYFNNGTIGVPDAFKAELWNGSAWQTLFSDTTGAMVLSPRSVTADLSGYTLSQNNKIRFSGTLQTSGAHWYVDGIQIYSP